MWKYEETGNFVFFPWPAIRINFLGQTLFFSIRSVIWSQYFFLRPWKLHWNKFKWKEKTIRIISPLWQFYNVRNHTSSVTIGSRKSFITQNPYLGLEYPLSAPPRCWSQWWRSPAPPGLRPPTWPTPFWMVLTVLCCPVKPLRGKFENDH